MLPAVSHLQYSLAGGRTDISHCPTPVNGRNVLPKHDRRDHRHNHRSSSNPVPLRHPASFSTDTLAYRRIIPLDQLGSDNLPHDEILLAHGIKQPAVLVASLLPFQNLFFFCNRKFAIKKIQQLGFGNLRFPFHSIISISYHIDRKDDKTVDSNHEKNRGKLENIFRSRFKAFTNSVLTVAIEITNFSAVSR